MMRLSVNLLCEVKIVVMYQVLSQKKKKLLHVNIFRVAFNDICHILSETNVVKIISHFFQCFSYSNNRLSTL